MNKLALVLGVALGPLTAGAHAQSENLSVLQEWFQFADAKARLQQNLNSVAFRMLREREEKIQTLRTAEDWERRRREVKETLQRIIGPFPRRTPLNAKVMSTVDADGYRVDKVVFESRPNFFVTANLFLTAAAGRNPVILHLSGHNVVSFRNEGAQTLILNLVRKGFNVFAVDPVGQGERLQYYGPELKRSLIGGPTAEHDYFGKQCFLTGVSSAQYFIWDIIRAMDYLETRPDVDAGRIGVTGNSGGGTLTAYMGAMDERVKAAAPSCYITSYRRLLEWMGPQDAEQNFVGGIANGLDHADLLEVRAPRATLVVTTTRDGFSIQGARETFSEARKAFRALGAEDNLRMVEDDYEHGYSPANREAIYAFFQKHLNHAGSAREENVVRLIHSVEDLTVTNTGQTLDSMASETVFSINRSAAEALLHNLDRLRRNLADHLGGVRKAAQGLSGYVAPEGVSGLMFMGRYRRDGYSIEMYLMNGEGNCLLPFLLMLPGSTNIHPAVVYLHPRGKSAAAAPGGEMEWFVKHGYAVLAPDLSGSGELGTVNDETSYLGMHTLRSIVGIRAGDIVRCKRYLETRDDIDATRVAAVAREEMGIPLLHAAAIEFSLSSVALIETPVSYRSVVMNRFYKLSYADLVTGALTAYDLPDLAACLAPRKLLIVNPTDQLLNPARRESIEEEYRIVRRAFSALGADGNLSVQMHEVHQSPDELFLPWLK